MAPPTPQERIQRNRALVEQAPSNHLARFGLANALFDAGDVAEAETQFRKCLEAQPEWIAALERQAGAPIVLRAEPALAISAGHVHRAQS